MTKLISICQVARLLAAVAALSFCSLQVRADTRTNWVERWVTNEIEVYIPANHLVTEYHTNFVIRTQTNFVNHYSTNVVQRFFTNQISVDFFRTNLISAYQTNFKTLNVTNWTTVVVLRTNWVQQTMTNVAEVEMAGEPTRSPSSSETRKNATSPSSSDALTLESSRGTRATASNQADVRLKARWSTRPDSEVQVQQWKVQSQEGSILCFGQDSEFRRNLPFGAYKVELKARLDSSSPVITARGTLVVNAREVTLDQNSLARK